MKLKELYPNTIYDLEITGITSDSRDVKEGYLFLPLDGNHFKSDAFYIDAITKKASVIVSDQYINNLTIPVITVDDKEKELKRLLKIFYKEPFNNLKLIGITGTDGKTTTATLLAHLLNTYKPSAYIGTNGIHSPFYDEDSIFTTPILSKTLEVLDKFVKDNINYCAMEVSSQGILNKRIENLLFDYTIFTNLSHEHLDTHKTMNNYFKTKLELFKQMKKDGIILVNKDDNYAKYFDEFENVLSFSIFYPSDYQAINIRYFTDYVTFDLLTKDKIYKNFKINKTEEYNIYNIIPSIVIALKENIPLKLIYSCLETLPNVKGRMEKVPTTYPFDIYVDFAHTPNGLKNMLINIRKKTKKRVILVCGAQGEKDASKRPMMGKYATEFSDFVIFTNEDPKCEKPEKIINDLTINIDNNNYQVIYNRKKAIDKAINIASPGDLVIVSGKGRENFYEENKQRVKYSDFDYILNKKD